VAYKRTQCYSTLILNLKELTEVDFDKRAFVFEDILFNRDVSKKQIVICKCYRFAFSSPQLKEGGCFSMVVPGREVSPLPQDAAEVADAEDGICTMIRILNLSKTHLETFRKETVDLAYLQKTLKNQLHESLKKELQELFPNEKAAFCGRIVNYLIDLQSLEEAGAQ